jgi:hypothetical protein
MFEKMQKVLVLGALALGLTQSSAQAQQICGVDTSGVNTNITLQASPPNLFVNYFEVNTAAQFNHLTGVNLPRKPLGLALGEFNSLRFEYYADSTPFSFPADTAKAQTMGTNLTVVAQTADGYYHVASNPTITPNTNDAIYRSAFWNDPSWQPAISGAGAGRILNRLSVVYAGGNNTNNINIGRFRINFGNGSVLSSQVFVAPSTQTDSTFNFQ